MDVTTDVSADVSTDVSTHASTDVGTDVVTVVSTVVSACKNIICEPGFCKLMETGTMCECPEGYVFDSNSEVSQCKGKRGQHSAKKSRP